MTEWQKKYRWVRTWPDDKGLDGKPLEDYAAYDGDQYAGRIRLEQQNLKKGMWHWAGAHPKPFHGEPIMPNAGYCETAALAAQAAEAYWDAMKARNQHGDQMRPPQLKYQWRRTWADASNDYSCFADGIMIGRVQHHTSGPVKMWTWAMAVDDVASGIMPATGSHDDKIEACRQLEAAYDSAVAKA